MPHAFRGANAFYSRKLLAILFGHFRADDHDPGPNLPEQTVFTCLSQDIIAHETTHALVDRLRPLFIEPSNRDVAGFHKGFADIVAIFQHFSFSHPTREDSRDKNGLTIAYPANPTHRRPCPHFGHIRLPDLIRFGGFHAAPLFLTRCKVNPKHCGGTEKYVGLAAQLCDVDWS